VTVCVCVCGRGVAGDPAQIKCSLNGSSKVRLGQKVDGDIQVNVKDKHGNEIKKVRHQPNTARNGFAAVGQLTACRWPSSEFYVVCEDL